MLKGLATEADIEFKGKIDQKGIMRSDGLFETSFGLMSNRYIKTVDNSVSVNSIPAKSNSENNKINQVQPMSFSNDYRSVTDSNDQTGTYWVVKSETGYKEATAFITLPTIMSMASTDRAYLFFSANTVSSSIVGDYGVVYVPNTGWIPFTNTGVWNTNTQEYDWTWRNGNTIPSNITYLYFDISVTSTTTNETIKLIIYNGNDFSQVLGTETLIFQTIQSLVHIQI